MPDITMCKGEGCPIREDCYRFTAKPSEYQQSYFIEAPIDGECEFFWPDKRWTAYRCPKCKTEPNQLGNVSGKTIMKCPDCQHVWSVKEDDNDR